MKNEGPSLEVLLRRLTETPEDFLAGPRTQAGDGVIHVPAVVSDLFALHGDAFPSLDGFVPENTPAAIRRANVVLLLAWLLAAPELIALKPKSDLLARLLGAGAGELAGQLPARAYWEDPERREELVRYALARLDLRPQGETPAQAQDRLTALSSIERARFLAASRQAEQRARETREALARKAAQEAADKYTRE